MDNATQSKMILEALQEGRTLTHLDAENEFKCLRLAARIYDLKKKGHAVEKRMITVNSGKKVACYFIPQEKDNIFWMDKLTGTRG